MSGLASHLGGRSVYLVDGARTPFLRVRGAPGPFRASDLAVAAARGLLLRQPFDPPDLDEVILGCVAPGPDEVNIGRVVALRLGCGHRVPGWSVQRNCASGLQAIDSAAKDIALGRAHLVLAGGTEAMSHHPVLLPAELLTWFAQYRQSQGVLARLRVLSRIRPRYLRPVIGLLRGLRDPVVGLSMGQTAEVLAARFRIGRSEMDQLAISSHQRLALAHRQGRLADEIVPLYQKGRAFTQDDGLRAESTLETLGRLQPAFDRPHGRVTAGNSAQVTDGAAFVLLASEDGMARHGLSPRARIIDCAWSGLDPAQMGLGPAYAIAQLLDRQGLELPNVDFWEINEAFAAQVLACLAALADPEFCRTELARDHAFPALNPERLNVDGGGISLGHPVGASGARITWHLLRVLEARGAARGIASLCIGGGQGGAILIERPNPSRQEVPR